MIPAHKHIICAGLSDFCPSDAVLCRQLARTLTQMTSRGEEVRPAVLQAAVQPLMRGCPLLAAQLSSLLDAEPPQAELTRRETDFQTAALDAEPADEFEEVAELEADEPDLYGTERCPCGCHQSGDDVRFLQRRRHCERCGLRFMAGRVYLQTGKVGVECGRGDEVGEGCRRKAVV